MATAEGDEEPDDEDRDKQSSEVREIGSVMGGTAAGAGHRPGVKEGGS
jgi:hypothetical protein